MERDMTPKTLPIIGQNTFVSIGPKGLAVPAKIDTGADRSAIWATDIKVKRDGTLTFKLFGPNSKYYTGKIYKRTDFEAAKVTSSNGQSEIRYRTTIRAKIAGRSMLFRFYLADRSRNTYPILIGRRSLYNKFLIDVSQKTVKMPKKPKLGINAQLKQNPYQFHKKYVKTNPAKEPSK